MSEYSRYDEYKFLVEDTARFTDRRQNASTLYTSINSIFLAALSLIVKDLNLLKQYTIFASLVMIGAGIVTSIYWRIYILNYKKLINLRFRVLKEMEQGEGMEKSVKIFEREKEIYKTNDNKGLFAVIEKKLPETFIGIYIIALIIILASPFLIGTP